MTTLAGQIEDLGEEETKHTQSWNPPLDSLSETRYYYCMEQSQDSWKAVYRLFPYFTFCLLLTSVIIAVSTVQQKQQTQSEAQSTASTPTNPPGYVQDPLDTQALVSIKLPGIGTDGNKEPLHTTRTANVIVYNLNNEQVASNTATLTYKGGVFSGITHLGSINPGTYTIEISTDGTVPSIVLPQTQTLTNTKLNILPVVGLLYGKIKADKTFDQAFYNAALQCFQSKNCENVEIVDFNDDGKTDTTDYNLLLQTNWKIQGE